MALFAEDPADGVYDIGFSAAIGADDASCAGTAEGDDGAFAKRLETGDFDFSQF